MLNYMQITQSCRGFPFPLVEGGHEPIKAPNTFQLVIFSFEKRWMIDIQTVNFQTELFGNF